MGKKGVPIMNRVQTGIDSDYDLREKFRTALTEAYGMFALGVKKGRVQNDEELWERLNEFFSACEAQSQFPTIEKMALALGYSTAWLGDVRSGRSAGFSRNTSMILEQAVQVISAVDAELASTGKIQPVVYLWRSKNFYGMRDTIEHTYHVEAHEKPFQELIRDAQELPGLPEAKAEEPENK